MIYKYDITILKKFMISFHYALYLDFNITSSLDVTFIIFNSYK
jgi:hypothetical protein